MADTPLEPVNALKFFTVVGKLKNLKRTGWIYEGVPLPESVADHMYRMSMLAFAVRDNRVNRDRLVKIALVHDLAEAIVGDITPHDGVKKEDKRALEEKALKTIVNDLGNSTMAAEIRELWLEYEEGNTLEADIAMQLDKFEMIVQANEYEFMHPGKKLEGFFQSTAGFFTHPEVAAWDVQLRGDRQKRWDAVQAQASS